MTAIALRLVEVRQLLFLNFLWQAFPHDVEPRDQVVQEAGFDWQLIFQGHGSGCPYE